MLRKLKIGKRLSVAFGIMTLLTVLVGLTAIQRFNSVEVNISNIAEHRLPASLLAGELNKDFLFIRLYTLNLMYAETDAERQRHRDRIRNELDNFKTNIDKVEVFQRTPEGHKVLEQVLKAKDGYDQLHQQILRLNEQRQYTESIALRNAGLNDAAIKVSNAISALADYQQERSLVEANSAKHTIELALSTMIAIVVFAVIGAVVLAYFFSRSLIGPMQNAVAICQRIASGDLTQKFADDAADEAGDMIRSMAVMQQQLQQTLSEINHSSSQLAATSEELSVVTDQSSQTLHQQSQELELAATAVTELTTAIEEVARSASATSSDSETANIKARQGKERVQHTIQTIQTLEGELQQARQGIQQLASRVNEISSVLDVIRGIAEQTNLLALNAAIEAARAGESGRGFAVVADEVRALAHRTQESTKEIERMMHLVQAETQTTVNTMQNSSNRATETLLIAQQAGDALQQIATAIVQINEQNLTIASAAEEQATVAREVDGNLLNIRDLSHQTSAGAHETQASSADLARLAETLNSLVTSFKV
ncbi:methyl-accepting chemotaxis protein [Shewanella putrefaciens]|uniref:methyl-accepting chemotaxis protein n=1 Tax=Shewanella putrefaciens TaxID=24 RepID=UPI0021BE2DD4|nr:methyl-accepting chemotaxis protein [Shewanella putrefaciens]UXK07339.1 methyl-accepting chemotaxis protein [Shewanella putrefaciens]